jgi:GAF domain-containing protein
VDYLDAIHQPEEIGFVFEQNKIAPLTDAEHPELAPDGDTLSAPLAVTGETLGTLVVEVDEQRRNIRATELVNAVARQVSQQIENLRLLESAERYRAEAEGASRRITREGWKDYTYANAGKGLSYIYDLKEVRPLKAGDRQAEESDVSLPLKVRDETVGKLVIQGLGADDSEALELANAVAERLGAHIESLRQFDETQRSQVELDKRVRQLAAVAEVSSVSSRELDIDKMLHSVVHLTQRQFGLYHAHVFIYNENTAELKIAACGYKEGDEHEGTDGTAVIPLAQEQSLVARAGRTRQAVTVNDVHNEPGWLPNPLLPDTNSEIAVPLIIGDQILGVLDVQSDILNAFSEEDANIYTTLASQVSTALQNANSFVRAQKQAERESTLNIISQKIQSATTVEAVLQIAARELGHALGAPMTIAQLSMKDKK